MVRRSVTMVRHGDEWLDENDPAGAGFLAEVWPTLGDSRKLCP